MEDSVLLEAQIQQKKMHNLLSELMDLTRQLMEAADRGDEVTIQLLVGMRNDPLEKMRTVRWALEQQRDSLRPEEGQRLASLLNGGAPENEAEKPLANQVAVNNRLLKELIEYDRRLSLKIAQEDSVYETHPGR